MKRIKATISTGTINTDGKGIRSISSEEYIYEEVIKLKEEVKQIKKKLDEILGEEE